MATRKEKLVDPKCVAELLSYCHMTGKLCWRKRIGNNMFNSRYAGREAFTSVERKGYKNGVIHGLHMKAHRIAWCVFYGCWPDGQIDHIDGDFSNNAIKNLRVVENMENCINQSTPKNNTSGYCGVSFCKQSGTWRASFKKNYVDYHVGYFITPEEANDAVIKARSSFGFHKNHGRGKNKVEANT